MLLLTEIHSLELFTHTRLTEIAPQTKASVSENLVVSTMLLPRDQLQPFC